MTAIAQKANGPAEAATSPDHGSNHLHANEKGLNVKNDSTSSVNVSRKSYSMDDAQLDAHHSHQLISTIVDLVCEMSFERDGKRDREMDRVAALLWIARDHAGQLTENIEVGIIKERLGRGAAQ